MSCKLVWFVPLLALPLWGCVEIDGSLLGQRIHGSGKVIQENRDVRGFRAVDFGGSGDLNVQQGNEESLSIQADDNLLPYITSEVAGGTLKIGIRRGVSISTSSRIRYELTVKELNALDLSGSGKTRIGPLRSQDFRIDLSGSGDIRLDGLDAGALNAEISGSGDMEIRGKVSRQEIHISGSGRYSAPDLECQTADVSVSGSGDCTLRAAQSLAAHISGSGSVGYYGSPSVTKRVSGSGSIRSLGNR